VDATVSRPVVATAVTEVTPGIVVTSLVTADSQCPQVMPDTE
jgi:hypothetical protein